MKYNVQDIRAHWFVATFFSSCLGIFAPASSFAQPQGVVPITAEPSHKIRFDNGRVRMYEVVLPKGGTSLMHEHGADNFTVFFRTAEVTNEPYGGGKPVALTRTPGAVGFSSTANGPYSHRITASGETAFHVIAMELLSPTPAGSATTDKRLGSAFKVALENPRGRAYRVNLAPGESTERFTRPAGSAIFAITAGRISESVDGKPSRLWDFEPAHFRWLENSEKVSVKNEGSTHVELVEIEVF